jgi:hypothetical protein
MIVIAKKIYITSRRSRYQCNFYRKAKEEKASNGCFTNYIQRNTFIAENICLAHKFDIHVHLYIKERKSHEL